MSTKFDNVLTVSGPHDELERFVTHTIQIRYDVDSPYAGKVPLFTLNALLPKPTDAPSDWQTTHWGCPFDTSCVITLPDMRWSSHCESIWFMFKTSNTPPSGWFETIAELFPKLHLNMSCVCMCLYFVVTFDAKNGKVTWEEHEGDDFLNNYCRTSGPKESQPPKYQPPADPDPIPIISGFATDCDVRDCLLSPLQEESPVALPDPFPDDAPWLDLSQPYEQEADDFSLDDEELELLPPSTDDWDLIFAPMEQADIEETIEAMGAPTPASTDLDDWPFCGTNSTPTFTWRGFYGWPEGVVLDTNHTLHVLLCVREHLGLPPLDPMQLLMAPRYETPAARPSWDRYAQENLFCQP